MLWCFLCCCESPKSSICFESSSPKNGETGHREARPLTPSLPPPGADSPHTVQTRVQTFISHQVSVGTGRNGCHAAGLKQEVATALRTLRDKLLAEQKEKERLAGSSGVAKRKHLERWELQECSMQQLSSLRASFPGNTASSTSSSALSSELVAHLLVRDQLRTKQDAMLLDVQDLT